SKNPALLLRSVRRAERAGNHDLRVGRVDHDAADPARLVEPHARPRLAGVGRFVDAVADGDVAANPRFAGAGPDDIRIRRRDSERSNRLGGLAVEDRAPVRAAVGGLVDAARRAAGVIHQRIAGNAGHRRNAVALGADEPPMEAAVHIGVRLWRCLRDEADVDHQARAECGRENSRHHSSWRKRTKRRRLRYSRHDRPSTTPAAAPWLQRSPFRRLHDGSPSARHVMNHDSLTIIDHRTGKQYEVPITDGTIPAIELRKIKTGSDDFGLMTY